MDGNQIYKGSIMIAKLIPTIRRSVANSARCFLRSTSRSALNRPLCYRSFSSTQFHNQQSKTPKQQDRIKIDKPSLLLAFTCKKCGTRSSHIISKQAYLTGSVLVECPSCKNRHLIADHLNIFHDGKINIEQILKAKGENVSQSTQDLCFDDIPESLKDMLGPYAKDAPKDYKNKASNDQNATHKLPKSGSTDKD